MIECSEAGVQPVFLCRWRLPPGKWTKLPNQLRTSYCPGSTAGVGQRSAESRARPSKSGGCAAQV